MFRDTLVAKAEDKKLTADHFIGRETRTAKSDGFQRAYLEDLSTRQTKQRYVGLFT